MNTDKQYALITGATSGIGLELAKLFVKDNYNLVIVARDEEELANAASTLRSAAEVEIITISKDLFKKESAAEIYQQLKEQGVQIDVLVNDAGQGVYGKFADNDIERELDIIQLNICSVVSLTKLSIRILFLLIFSQ